MILAMNAVRSASHRTIVRLVLIGSAATLAKFTSHSDTLKRSVRAQHHALAIFCASRSSGRPDVLAGSKGGMGALPAGPSSRQRASTAAYRIR